MLHVDEIYHIIKTRLYMKTLIPIYVMILCLFNYQPGYIYRGEKGIVADICITLQRNKIYHTNIGYYDSISCIYYYNMLF